MPASAKKKQFSPSLGDTLLKNKHRTRSIRVGKGAEDVIFAEDISLTPKAVGSVTEMSSLDDFLLSAQMSEISFASERNYTIAEKYQSPSKPSPIPATASPEAKELKAMLRIPRRPPWNHNMDAKELQRLENNLFISWRRSLALFQERNDKIVMTPYELNLDMWRQLWRVIERSNMVIQIVDARNPLLFMCSDLDTYIKEEESFRETKIPLLLLLNKADLLTEPQREVWLKYFKSQDIACIFYSANATSDSPVSEPSSCSVKSDEHPEAELEKNAECVINSTKIASPKALLLLLESMRGDALAFNVGLVGYPNVGKSSTINSILQAKRVRVGATPGKTKHLQTIFIDEEHHEPSDSTKQPICLVDCPGLVFPNFASTRAELVVNGILPIDHLRDPYPSCDLVASRISRSRLNSAYGITLPFPGEGEPQDRPPTGLELLTAYVNARGLGSDFSKASRTILKDYTAGTRLLYVHPPPGYPEFVQKENASTRHSKSPPKQQPLVDHSSFEGSWTAYTKGKFASSAFTGRLNASENVHDSSNKHHRRPRSRK